MTLDPLLDRVPPSAIDSEQEVLGVVMVHPSTWHEITAPEVGLITEAFYRPVHAQIFATLKALADKNEPLDCATVAASLTDAGLLEDVGGALYLAQLVDSIATTGNAVWHAERVMEAYRLRRCMDMTLSVSQAALAPEAKSADVLALAEQQLLAISHSRHAGLQPYSAVVVGAYDTISEAYRGGGAIEGLSYGIRPLDELTLGMHRQDLIVLASRPGLGKTALAQEIAHSVAASGVGVLFVELEMGWRQLGFRAFQQEALINGYALRRPRFGDEVWDTLGRAVGKLSEYPIWLAEASSLTDTEIYSMTRRAALQHQIGLVIVDHLQLVRGPANVNRNLEIGAITRTMKAAAKALDLPVMLLSQLSRQSEVSKERPGLAALRDSGEIEANADVVLLLWRPPSDADNTGGHPTTLIVVKNRNLMCGDVHLVFRGQYTRFEEASNRADE